MLLWLSGSKSLQPGSVIWRKVIPSTVTQKKKQLDIFYSVVLRPFRTMKKNIWPGVSRLLLRQEVRRTTTLPLFLLAPSACITSCRHYVQFFLSEQQQHLILQSEEQIWLLGRQSGLNCAEVQSHFSSDLPGSSTYQTVCFQNPGHPCWRKSPVIRGKRHLQANTKSLRVLWKY